MPVLTRATIETDVNFRIYTDPAIQAELKLSDEQKARIARIPDDLLAKYKNEMDRERADRKEKADRAAGRNAEAAKKLDSLLEKRFSAEQKKRFHQLIVQVQGPFAFRDPDIAKALGLTAGQQSKVAELQQAAFDKLQKEISVVSGRSVNAEEYKKRIEAVRTTSREIIRQCVETLTAQQKKAWADLNGEPSDAAQNHVNQSSSFLIGNPFAPAVVSPFTPGTPFWLRWTVLSTRAIRAELKLDDNAEAVVMKEWQEVAQSISDTVVPSSPATRTFSRLPQVVLPEAVRLAAAILTEPQTKRMEQLQFQLARLSVFQSGRWSGNLLIRLHLTPAQLAKLEATLTEASRKTGSLPVPSGSGQSGQAEVAERISKAIAIQQNALAAILATFDPGQIAVWKEHTGEVIDVSNMAVQTNIFRVQTGQARNDLIMALSSDANAKIDAGEYAAAIAVLDEALRIEPGNRYVRVRKASLLSICPSEWIRDGKRAVELMKGVMAETKTPDVGDYVVLGVAFAEAGQFDDAVKAQEKAIELAKRNPVRNTTSFGGQSNEERIAGLEARLKLYQSRKPFHMDPPGSSNPMGGR